MERKHEEDQQQTEKGPTYGHLECTNTVQNMATEDCYSRNPRNEVY
jgi:hypothetical protein